MARKIPAAEMQVRTDLAACYRLVEHFGMSDLLASHISARVPGTKDEFLLNPYGMYFDEITATSLLRVNYDGEILDDTNYSMSTAAFNIHSAVLKGRPDLTCALHTHTVAGMAVSSIEEGVLPLNQLSIAFYKRIAYHDYEGPASREGGVDECEALQRDLGQDKKVMVLRNHGLLTTGESIPEAFGLMRRLEKVCETQMYTMAMQGGGGTMRQVSYETCEDYYQIQNQRGRSRHDGAWPALLRKLERIDPSYRN
ncbi:MAG TPA: class II aldolase [Rhodospirillaceae bacterium]|nr:class II aldolase [Rhodospirillaceae bacterium]